MSIIKAAISETEKMDIEADVKEGLAIHEKICLNQMTGELYLSVLHYTITHIKTGWSVMSNIESKEDAIELREKFLKIFDWNKNCSPRGKIVKQISHKVITIKDKYFDSIFM